MINGLRVAAITPLHFGLSYLPYAMRSVADVVDLFLIMYSPTPNHGTYSSALPCPESRDMLLEAAYQTAPDRTRWFEWDGWKSEGEQFKFGWQHTDADVIVKLDADECWHPGLLENVIRHAAYIERYETRVKLRHYWRSFRKAFTHDPAAPGRVYIRNAPKSEGTHGYMPDPEDWDVSPQKRGEAEYLDHKIRIHHMGYALPVDVTRYKMSIHGHKAEFKNPNWFNEVWLANRQTDCHPIGSDAWQVTEDVSVPPFLADHPFVNLDIIE